MTPGRILDGPVISDLGTGPEVFFGDVGLSETNNNGSEWAITGADNALGGCKLIWSFNNWGVTNGGTQTGSWSPPGLAYDTNQRPLLVFGTSQPDSSVYALDARTGSLVWRHNTSTMGDLDVGAGPSITAPGVNGLPDGAVYIDGKTQILYALDLMTGNTYWSFDMKAALGAMSVNSVSTPAVVGSSVLVGYGYGVWAFDAATGTRQWYSGTSSPVGGVVFSSPAVAGASGDQVIYSNDGGGAITAYGLSDGRTLWRYVTSRPILGSDAIADGQVFFGGLDSNIYAFGPSEPTRAPVSQSSPVPPQARRSVSQSSPAPTPGPRTSAGRVGLPPSADQTDGRPSSPNWAASYPRHGARDATLPVARDSRLFDGLLGFLWSLLLMLL
jgi:glucose dehydrogenase